ncbi:MAG: MerC domain-containing protein [Gammaproteobacteria bacterium]|nr:MerC domain-containing protein [Gammaproteobacteria bacterium]MDH4253857.1 MerC domain-containing protein [Gammaproteobacteria bacterium]MDH5310450.1 MerC domain-containing protein [Gammaproteobacteria bacterium]
MDNSTPDSGPVLDKLAIGLSGLCLVHCLALPLLIAAAPFLGELSQGHLHAQMLVVILPLSTIALAMGFRRHQNRWIIAWATLGMLLLVLGGTVMHAEFGLIWDRAFTMTGSVVLAVSHWFNSRLGRRHARRPVRDPATPAD